MRGGTGLILCRGYARGRPVAMRVQNELYIVQSRVRLLRLNAWHKHEMLYCGSKSRASSLACISCYGFIV